MGIPFLYTVPAPPSDVVVERVNATHMEVRWTALSPVEARGHITHYTISYWPASNSEPVTSITVHNTTSTSYRVLIGGLLSGEAYVVEVSASTAAGDGDKAEVTLSGTGGNCLKCGECVLHVMIHVYRRCLTSCSSGCSWSHCCCDPNDHHHSLHTPDTAQVTCNFMHYIILCVHNSPTSSTHQEESQ